MLARGLLGLPRYPLRLLRALPGALPNLDETAFGTLPGAGTVARVSERVCRALRRATAACWSATNLKAPKTSFNGRISPHRRFAFGQLPLDEVKDGQEPARRAPSTTWWCRSAPARCAAGWIEHGELPDEPLVAQIPVSVRSERADGHLRQPDHADERRRCSPTSRTRWSGCSTPTRR